MKLSFNGLTENGFENFWVEFKVSNSYQSTACEYRLYPYKKFHKQFLEEIWTSAYCVMLDNNLITLIRPYNVNYLQQQEKENLEFVVKLMVWKF